ncbi:MAG: hypothetical protein KAI71_00170 [Candidatus Pacebacteria bacterium]|nr:hypothetical protein [Candidatus Paceibacterota bacterium]
MQFVDGYKGLMNTIKKFTEELNKEIEKTDELRIEIVVLKAEINYLNKKTAETIETGEIDEETKEILSIIKMRIMEKEILEYEFSDQEKLIKEKRFNLSALTEANFQLNWGGPNVPYPACPR